MIEAMQVKPKFCWQIITILMGSSIPFMLYNKYINSEYYNLTYLFMVIVGPFIMVLFIFIAPTARITFSDDKIDVYWKIGVGKFHIYEMKKYQIYYNNITGVLSIFPVWFPIPVLMISGNGNSLVLGTIFTKKTETFTILANKIDPEIMDSESRRILKEYKTKNKRQEYN